MNAADPYICVPEGCTGIFDDVSYNSPFGDYVGALYYYGIVSGCQLLPPLYCHELNVQRGSMAKLICLAMNEVDYWSCYISGCSGIFADVDSSNPFCQYIEALYEAEVVSGCHKSPLLYCPNDNVTRAQMAKFLIKAFGLSL